MVLFAFKYQFSFNDFGVVNVLDESERDLYIIYLMLRIALCILSWQESYVRIAVETHASMEPRTLEQWHPTPSTRATVLLKGTEKESARCQQTTLIPRYSKLSEVTLNYVEAYGSYID